MWFTVATYGMEFKTWFESNDTAADVAAGFDALRGGFKDMTERKVMEYAQRVMNGERPEDVMQGLRVGGAMWQAVMAKVAELQGQQQPKSSQGPQLSVSDLERRLGVRAGTLSITPSRDGRHIYVRNRLNGQSITVNADVQEIEAAARKLFGLV